MQKKVKKKIQKLEKNEIEFKWQFNVYISHSIRAFILTGKPLKWQKSTKFEII
jgi:hypothetical protein